MKLRKIESRSNPLIREIRRLYRRQYRERRGLFVIEGMRLVREAVSSSIRLKRVLVTDAFLARGEGKRLSEMLEELGVELVLVNEEVLADIADTESPQGVLAVCGIDEYEDIGALLATGDLFTIVDGVREPGNLGTIIRTADAAGARAVFVTRGTVDPYNPKVVRASMGSIFHIPVVGVESLDRVIEALRVEGARTIAGDARASKPLYSLDLTGRVAIVVGNEARGSPEASRLADEVVAIPVVGRSESLNVAVAASIMLYEVVRQRYYAKSPPRSGKGEGGGE